MRLPSALLIGMLLLVPATGCLVPENMTALREELGYASVETPDLVVKARASTLEPKVEQTVRLTAEVEGVPATAASLTWTLGDTTAYGDTLEHAFSEPGEVIVELEALGPEDARATDTLTLTVHENRAPVPRISIQDGDTLTAEKPVHLSALGSSDPDGDPLTYAWTIDGDEQVTGAEIERSLEAGLHEVQLVADDGIEQTTTFARFGVALPIASSGSVDTTQAVHPVGFTVLEGVEALEVTLEHTTRLGVEDVHLVLVDSRGEEVAASRASPDPGATNATEHLEVPGSDLAPGAYTLQARLDRGISSEVTIEGVLTYSALPADPG